MPIDVKDYVRDYFASLDSASARREPDRYPEDPWTHPQPRRRAPPAEAVDRARGFARTRGGHPAEIGKVIVGQDDLVRQMLICLLANAHALLEGVPGLGKTMLVRTIADVIDCAFNRIQFTPDLMPADIVGTNILVEEGGTARVPLPAGPGLRQPAAGRRDQPRHAQDPVGAAGGDAGAAGHRSPASRYPLEPPFFVLATQNPLEMEGTYPLPEAQLDRFLFKLWVPVPLRGGPDRDHRADDRRATPTARQGRATPRTIVAMQRLARSVPIAPHVTAYAVVRAGGDPPGRSRARPSWCASTCATAARRAAPRRWCWRARSSPSWTGRFNVAVDDIRAVALPALRHRVIRNFEAEAEGITSDAVVRSVLDAIAPPRVD